MLKSVGERFSELRNRSGLTQSQIADYLNVDQSYISKYEKNERQFSVDILEKAAALFGCPIEYFTDETSEYEPMHIAFRAKSVTVEDLETIAAINKIALNLRYMEGLLEGGKNEREYRIKCGSYKPTETVRRRCGFSDRNLFLTSKQRGFNDCFLPNER